MVVVLILEEINNENKSKVIKKKKKISISGGRRVGGAWGRDSGATIESRPHFPPRPGDRLASIGHRWCNVAIV